MRRARRPWTASDDANLRKFHAEGKTDAVIAYIIGRAKQSVWTRRVRLGLKTHDRKPGGFTYSHTPEARARIAEFRRIYVCPSTGQYTGPCPGYQIDHHIPLCAGGPDTVSNLNWMSIEDHKAKTKLDMKECRKR